MKKHNYKVTLSETYNIVAESESFAKLLAYKAFGKKYNCLLSTKDNHNDPIVSVAAKMEAFDFFPKEK